MNRESDSDDSQDVPTLILRTSTGREFEVDTVDPTAAAWDLMINLPRDQVIEILSELINRSGDHAGDDVLPLLRELADRLGYDLVERI